MPLIVWPNAHRISMHMSLISDDSRHDDAARTIVAIRTEVDRTRVSGSGLRNTTCAANAIVAIRIGIVRRRATQVTDAASLDDVALVALVQGSALTQSTAGEAPLAELIVSSSIVLLKAIDSPSSNWR
jgi:hypothetical protein